mgnify:CR=1 FL=1
MEQHEKAYCMYQMRLTFGQLQPIPRLSKAELLLLGNISSFLRSEFFPQP